MFLLLVFVVNAVFMRLELVCAASLTGRRELAVNHGLTALCCGAVGRPILVWETAWLTVTTASYMCEEGSTKALCNSMLVQLATNT